MKVRNVILTLTIALMGLAGACATVAPVSQVQIVIVSPSPVPGAISITVTPLGSPSATLPASTPGGSATTSGVVPGSSLSALPMQTSVQTYIAQQDFQHGYMYWISTRKEIWVLLKTQDTQESGEWQRYPDTFQDGEPETDPSLVAPSVMLYQPKRGFGKVWRQTPGLRDRLGWATTPEFDLRTPLIYEQGMALDASGKLTAQPGHYELTSLYCQPFALFEPAAGQASGTWTLLGRIQPGPARPDGTSTPVPTATPFTPPAPGTPLTALPAEQRSQLYIAQQDFEHGYMFWLSNQGVIWVLIRNQSGDQANESGEWRVYQDTFQDGEPETDPSLTPPTTTPLPLTLTPEGVPMYQPRRGFGKLWRITPGLREALGWATTPDFDLRTPFVYEPGLSIDASGKLIAQPGRYLLTSLGCVTFQFDEPKSGQASGSWTRAGGVYPGPGTN